MSKIIKWFLQKSFPGKNVKLFNTNWRATTYFWYEKYLPDAHLEVQIFNFEFKMSIDRISFTNFSIAHNVE